MQENVPVRPLTCAHERNIPGDPLHVRVRAYASNKGKHSGKSPCKQMTGQHTSTKLAKASLCPVDGSFTYLEAQSQLPAELLVLLTPQISHVGCEGTVCPGNCLLCLQLPEIGGRAISNLAQLFPSALMVQPLLLRTAELGRSRLHPLVPEGLLKASGLTLASWRMSLHSDSVRTLSKTTRCDPFSWRESWVMVRPSKNKGPGGEAGEKKHKSRLRTGSSIKH